MSAPTDPAARAARRAGLLLSGLVLMTTIAAAATVAAEPLRFLALGDSYTIGEGVPATERWPEQLVARLAARGHTFAPPTVIARTGWTTAELDQAIARAAPRGPFDLVSLMVGVNNQFRGLPLAQYEPEFATLLGQAVALAGGRPGRVLVLSIPDYSVTPFARRTGRDRPEVPVTIAKFNAAARAAAIAAGARWVDVTPASMRAATAPELVGPDNLHPSATLHAEWAELALPHALAALEVTSGPAAPATQAAPENRP